MRSTRSTKGRKTVASPAKKTSTRKTVKKKVVKKVATAATTTSIPESIPASLPESVPVSVPVSVPESIPETSAVEKRKRTPSPKLGKDEILVELDNLLTNTQTLLAEARANKHLSSYKNLLITNSKTIKLIRKNVKSNLRGKVTQNRRANTTSGFEKPLRISNHLSDFAGWPRGELKCRNDVTRLLCSYVKNNNLQNPDRRTQIIPDEKLQQLLDPRKEFKDTLQYTSMQKLIQHHFIKKKTIFLLN
eukprot:Pgem_evm1s11233